MRKGEKRPDLQKARIATCETCGKEFRAVKDYSTDKKTVKQKYCSKGCWSNRVKKKTITCPECGKKFHCYPSQTRKYCSVPCRNNAYKKLTGEKSHRWKGGKSSEQDIVRSSSEYKEWRLKVFKRDGFECQICGNKKHIHAHHIESFSDSPEKRMDVKNGITLCHTCHSIHHGWRIGEVDEIMFNDEENKNRVKLFMNKQTEVM